MASRHLWSSAFVFSLSFLTIGECPSKIILRVEVALGPGVPCVNCFFHVRRSLYNTTVPHEFPRRGCYLNALQVSWHRRGTVIYIFVLISFSCYGDFIVLISFSCRPPAMAGGSMVIQGNEYHGARDGTVMHLKSYACMGSMNHVVLPCAGHAVNPGSITPCSGLFR